ncbi:MAG: hypothetical protein ACLTGT_06240 [Oscillospiraceae bacterium]
MVPVLCVFDNEEIGSRPSRGAASVFLPETLAAISRRWVSPPPTTGRCWRTA